MLDLEHDALVGLIGDSGIDLLAVGGTTDSYGPSLRPVTDGLGLVPYSNGVHHDSEPERRPLFHRLIAEGVIPSGYAIDDGVGVVYQGTSFAGAVAENR